MYCTNCGYELNEKQINNARKGHTLKRLSTKQVYICPRCGKIIKDGLSEEDIKDLSRASHAEIHRSRNMINSGMCFLVIGAILSIISYMFFLMSFKASAGGMLIPTCTEFYVFIVLLVLGVASLVYSITSLVLGKKKNKKYSAVIKDINNGVFSQ